MIKLSNVYCGYNKINVLKNINLTISPNENLCVLGPNGSGKTTLLKAIGGILPVSKIGRAHV